MELKLNIAAILVTVVANFILGFLWYTPLFGNVWAKEMGFDRSVKPKSGLIIKGMIFMVIGNFFFAWVFAHNIAAWDFVPGVKEMGPMASALNSAFFTWLGFYFPGHLGATVWENKSWKLFGINAGYNLAGLLVAAFILCYWK